MIRRESPAPAGAGTLFVVPTPIGNLEDVTLRALRVLRDVDRIAAEDTRHTKVLLRHHGIDRPMTSLHEHNEAAKTPSLLASLRAGRSIALVTDAGTPGVSDPGYRLIAAAREAEIPVEVLPGPSAVTTALVASGLPTDRFLFVGFPPRKPGARARWAGEVLRSGATIVLFESPRRLVETLGAIAAVAPDRPTAVCRELTKRHEEVVRGPAASVRETFAARPEVLGEVAVVLAPSPIAAAPATDASFDEAAEIERLRAEGKRDREIAQAIARATGRPKREVYARLIDRPTGSGRTG